MPNVTQKKKVLQYILEKDYALTYLLAAIVQADGLGDNLVLKGGTALKKLYFADYRFSDYREKFRIWKRKNAGSASKSLIRKMRLLKNAMT